MQGYIDGVESLLGEVERLAHEKKEEINPNY